MPTRAVPVETVWNRLFPAWKKAVKPIIPIEKVRYTMGRSVASSGETIAIKHLYGKPGEVNAYLRDLKKQAENVHARFRFEHEVLEDRIPTGGMYLVNDTLIDLYLSKKRNQNKPTT